MYFSRARQIEENTSEKNRKSNSLAELLILIIKPAWGKRKNEKIQITSHKLFVVLQTLE